MDRARLQGRLHEHSVESCKLYLGPGKRARDASEEEVKVRRYLNDSRRQLYHMRGAVLGCKCSESTWYRQVKRQFPEIGSTTRKLDMCAKCMQWDKQAPLLVYVLACVLSLFHVSLIGLVLSMASVPFAAAVVGALEGDP